MKQPSWWFTPAVILAFVAGVLRGLRPYLPPMLVGEFGSSSILYTLVLLGSSIGEMLATPIGIFIAGYIWGTHEDVRSAYRGFSLIVYGVALLGLVVATLARFVAFSGPVSDSLSRQLLSFGLPAFDLLSVPLAALAGGAVGHFRSVEDTAGIQTETAE